VLGLSQDASPVEARAAWRRLAEVYDPARHTDASREVQAEAARRLAEVNAAYLDAQERPSSAQRALSQQPILPLGASVGGNARRRVASIVLGVLVACIGAIVAVALVTQRADRGTTQHYPVAVQAAFTNACEANVTSTSVMSPGDTSTYCGCVLSHLEAQFNLAAFRAAERLYATTGVEPAWVVASSKMCIQKQVNDKFKQAGQELSRAGS